MDFVNNLFFGYLPYIAVAAFLVGVIYHCIVSDKTIHATSTIFLQKDNLIKWGSPMFHFGIIAVFFGHLFGLFTPMFVVEWIMPLETKRMLAIIIGLTAAAIALAGLLMLLIRRFTSTRVAKTSSFQDYFIVILILVQICLGIASTIITTRSSLDDYLAFDKWAQGMVWFEPNAWRYILESNIVYKLHIVNGLFIFMIFPYTKLMHMIRLPLRYSLERNKIFPSDAKSTRI